MIKRLFYYVIASLHDRPFVIASYIGSLTFLVALISFIHIIVRDINNSISFLSLGSILSANIMTLGLTLYSLGTIGEYLGRTFNGSK